MINKPNDYRYHIFGILRGNSKNLENYVLEGASGGFNQPKVHSTKQKLASSLCAQHCDDRVFGLDYFSVSFDPPCDNVLYLGDIYKTQKLSPNDQKYFLQNLRKEVNKLKSM